MALSEEKMAENLEEIKKIQIFLDPDPTVKGLVSLNYKIAEIQLAKDRLSGFILEAMRNVAEHDIIKETVQHDHDRQLELLVTTDQACLAAKSAEARNVAARIKMPEKVLALHHAEVAQIKASWYMKILQSVHSNIESTNGNLSRQITVIQMDQNLQGNSGGNRGSLKNINV